MAKKKAKAKGHPVPDDLLKAAVEFRESLTDRADAKQSGTFPLWHGWALVDCFIAGAKWQAKKNSTPKG